MLLRGYESRIERVVVDPQQAVEQQPVACLHNEAVTAETTQGVGNHLLGNEKEGAVLDRA